ncbi:peritrophin-48-like isoform X1 [Anastrepha ludens]|uniref:peritrophin-48-like isoform X1 n=1 Tax=Anastrepha ludens TaxID=28586 RepID=UPI0023AE854E|nr:peritrophin-48-like isoform X1 [Anastrepha ludens]
MSNVVMLLVYIVTILTATIGCNGIRHDNLTNFDTRENSYLVECDNKPYGYKIPDLTDCFGYFICHGDMIIQQYCPLGERFNTSLQSCQLGKCPPCSCENCAGGNDSDGIDCSVAPNGARFGDVTHCRYFWQCVNGRAVRLFCERGMWYDRVRYVCNFPALVNNCPANRD